MATLEKRLLTIESALTPKTTPRLVIRITRAGCDEEIPTAWRHHTTGEIYPVDYDFDTMKGYNVLFAEYSP